MTGEQGRRLPRGLAAGAQVPGGGRATAGDVPAWAAGAERLGAELALDLPATRQQVSALLATYNRCPFDPTDAALSDNPLTWTLDTLLAQADQVLREIIVVDDGSSDYTSTVLASYQDQAARQAARVPVVVVRHASHQGATAPRNTAIDAATSDLLLFGDDDCIFGPH